MYNVVYAVCISTDTCITCHFTNNSSWCNSCRKTVQLIFLHHSPTSLNAALPNITCIVSFIVDWKSFHVKITEKIKVDPLIYKHVFLLNKVYSLN